MGSNCCTDRLEDEQENGLVVGRKRHGVTKMPQEFDREFLEISFGDDSDDQDSKGSFLSPSNGNIPKIRRNKSYITISSPLAQAMGEGNGKLQNSKIDCSRDKLFRTGVESQNFTNSTFMGLVLPTSSTNNPKSSDGEDRIAPFMEELQNTYTSMRLQKRKKMKILEKIKKSNSRKRFMYQRDINQEIRCTSLD
ncbi:unnamed protein product [Moneuplotes crassus]|uniref:Uncharacterized protein n=1 Tax=Euplotes crassus TaxID=5936 RepID=A0AAD2CZW8_EUPCR|nr:unnamed protein product [Moneuplotes crassus]